ncbi:MAG: phenylacetate--CoA ligase family protein [Rhodospirillaceae bacterium]|nr:phenylacetate--CoA ligase family protein [Rhodospirillaceae bacterium]
MTTYFEEANPAQILRDYPIGEDFATITAMSRDALHALQERRFRQVVARGWQVPFYRRHWNAAGLEPGDIQSLDDLVKIPTFSKSDLMASVEAHPPLGDFHGMEDGRSIVLHTTSGTTGTPQPLLYGAYDREVQNALLARAYLLQGLRPEDVVHSVYGFGMVNGGHYIRETMLHYTKSMLLSAGTGLETRSEQQVALMKRFGATVIVGFADYIAKLAQVALEAGLEPGRDIPIRMISGHLSKDGRATLETAWPGAEAYDWYGVGDTGIVAAEGPDQDGLYLWEDAHLVEILDPDTGAPLVDGETGNICVTPLFKTTIYPVIRFDTKDVSTILPGEGALGPALRRIAGFQGRSDNMVKLRGVNVYPTAIAPILAAIDGLNGEYVCKAHVKDGREEMTVMVETSDDQSAPGLQASVSEELRRRLGVGLLVELTGPGGTAALTQIESRQKPIRLIDER